MGNTSRKAIAVKRQREFKKALIDEGTTITAFAGELAVHRVHLMRAFRDPSLVSQRIHDAIDALIAKHRRTVAA
jgi:hypothetical protein